MKNNWKAILILFSFILLSAWFYPVFLGNWAAMALPSFSSLPKNRILHLAIFSLNGSIGALICAFILAFPMGYFTRHKPIIIGGTLGIVGEMITAYRFPIQFNWFVGIITIAEYAAFILGCVLFTWCGYRVGNRRKRTG